MDSIDIHEIQKNYFSNTHSSFDKFLKNIKNKNNLSNNNLKKIIILNKKMLEINNILDDINYEINKTKPKLSINVEKELIEYENNDRAVKQFLPYMMYYRFIMDMESESE